jgi:hypothetical protein
LGVTVGLLICFYRLQPLWAKNIYVTLVRHHAIAVLGFVLAFIAMNFRTTAVDYLAFVTASPEPSPLPWRMTRDEANVRQNYERQYGKDAYYRMPDAFGFLSIITFLISGLGLVLSH